MIVRITALLVVMVLTPLRAGAEGWIKTVSLVGDATAATATGSGGSGAGAGGIGLQIGSDYLDFYAAIQAGTTPNTTASRPKAFWAAVLTPGMGSESAAVDLRYSPFGSENTPRSGLGLRLRGTQGAVNWVLSDTSKSDKITIWSYEVSVAYFLDVSRAADLDKKVSDLGVTADLGFGGRFYTGDTAFVRQNSPDARPNYSGFIGRLGLYLNKIRGFVQISQMNRSTEGISGWQGIVGIGVRGDLAKIK